MLTEPATNPEQPEPATATERKRWAAAQRRRRARAAAGMSVFKLPLRSHLVALALERSAYGEGVDLTDHAQCETALAEMLKEALGCVIDDLPNGTVRALMAQ